MEHEPEFDLDAVLKDLAEIGVGAAILGLRRINISRRKLVKDIPATAPVVDAALDAVEAMVGPASAMLGSAVSSVGDAVRGEHGARLNEAGRFVASSGPELLRLSGLTRRD